MAEKGLLFIPDISGFSRFVNETEIDHSRLIIQELLETLINANRIGLQISEIEGDAILFYRFGPQPDLGELYRQVEEMFCAFHRNVMAYDLRRYCQCRACTAAADLTLKIVSHYGEFTRYSVKSFDRLIGKDIILVHELLKNDIEQHEYWLVTEPLVPGDEPPGLTTWMEWRPGEKQTRGGDVGFRYAQLGRLKEGVSPELPDQMELAGTTRVLSAAREYDVDIITLFHATGDFNYRAKWRVGVKAVEEVGHLLPRVGMRCRCILESGESYTYSNSYSYATDRIEFSEADEGRRSVTSYLLEALGPRRTRLTISYHLPRTPAALLRFRFTRQRAMAEELERSMENLVAVAGEIRLPGSIEAEAS